MRMAKLKSRVSLVRSAQHNTRERKPPNSDEARLGQNVMIGGTVEEIMKRYSGQLPASVRKNAVHAVEVVMTFSPGHTFGLEGSGSLIGYLNDCGQWVEGIFGKENVLHIAKHWDETTPHVHALVMPLKDGKLNAKAFIGGSRDRMAELQNDFFEKVGRKHGLERGQSREETKARHSHHTLAGKITEADVIKKALEKESYHLAERTKGVELREQSLKKESAGLDKLGEELQKREEKLKEVSTDFKRLLGMKPADVIDLKKRLDTWEKKTATELKVLAGNMEKRGCRSVAEYRIAVEAQKPQQQTRKI